LAEVTRILSAIEQGDPHAERQALAMMDHINIARILDAGAMETGRTLSLRPRGTH
jgi:hypothetical protein